MRRWAIQFAVAVLLAGPSVGCGGGGREKPSPAAFDYSMRLSGYDVPRPASVPFDDPEDAHEYLFFYHSAYWLTANHPDLEAATETDALEVAETRRQFASRHLALPGGSAQRLQALVRGAQPFRLRAAGGQHLHVVRVGALLGFAHPRDYVIRVAY